MLVLSFHPDPGPLHLLLPTSQTVFPHGAPWFVLTPSPKCPPALSHFLPISLLPFPLRSYYLTNYIFHSCILFSLPHLLEYKLYEEGTIYFHLFPKYMPRAWESIVLNKYLLNKRWVIWICEWIHTESWKASILSASGRLLSWYWNAIKNKALW